MKVVSVDQARAFLILSSLLLMLCSMASSLYALSLGATKNSLFLYPLIYFLWACAFFFHPLLETRLLRGLFVCSALIIFVLAYRNMEDLGDKAGMSAFTIGSNLFGFLFAYLALSSAHLSFRVLFFVLLLLTFSRLGILAFFLGKVIRQPLSILIFILVFMLVYFLYQMNGLWGLDGFKWVFRVGDSGRTEKLQMALEAIFHSGAQKILLGSGPGMYGVVVEDNPYSYAHNVILQYFIEMGVIGLLALLLFFASLSKCIGYQLTMVIFTCSLGETVFENYIIALSIPFLAGLATAHKRMKR